MASNGDWKPTSKEGRIWDNVIRDAQNCSDSNIKGMGELARMGMNKYNGSNNNNNSGCVVMLPIIGLGLSSLVGLSIYLIA